MCAKAIETAGLLADEHRDMLKSEKRNVWVGWCENKWERCEIGVPMLARTRHRYTEEFKQEGGCVVGARVCPSGVPGRLGHVES
jgi:hypothetical protein